MATKSNFPKSIGASIDLLYTLRSNRLAEEKKIETLKLQESSLKDHIMANFAKADLDGAKGKVATASIKHSVQANITDWEKYVKWCVKNEAYGCIQKRAGITALREYWDNKKEVPGVEQVVVEDLSLTKV
jgi:hypothetical protein